MDILFTPLELISRSAFLARPLAAAASSILHRHRYVR
jgi:hypothetical protein